MQQVAAMTDEWTDTTEDADLPNDLMSISEAARIVHLKRARVAMWALRGHLRTWQRGVGPQLVSLAELRDLLRIRGAR